MRSIREEGSPGKGDGSGTQPMLQAKVRPRRPEFALTLTTSTYWAFPKVRIPKKYMPV